MNELSELLKERAASVHDDGAAERRRFAEAALLLRFLEGFENQRHGFPCIRRLVREAPVVRSMRSSAAQRRAALPGHGIIFAYWTVRASRGPESSSADSANSVSGPTMPSARMP